VVDYTDSEACENLALKNVCDTLCVSLGFDYVMSSKEPVMRRIIISLLSLALLTLAGCIFASSDDGVASTSDAEDTSSPSDTSSDGEADTSVDGGDAGTDGDDGDAPPACANGETLCNGDCVDTSTDRNHCNQCGNVCDADPSGYEVACVNSSCQTLDTCAEDFVDLDGDDSNGCECDISDPADPPGDRIDANCDGFDGNLDAAIFVRKDAGGDGSIDSPRGDLQAAIDEAAQSDTLSQVFVSKGTYSDGLVLGDGVTVTGGYSDDFQTWHPQSQKTVIEGIANPSESGELHTVEADGVTDAALIGLEIRGSVPAQPGASTVVVYANGADGLSLSKLTLDGGDAAKGPEGTDAPATDGNSCTPHPGGPGGDVENINPCRQTSNNTSNPGTDGEPFGTSDGAGGMGGSHRCPVLPTGLGCIVTDMRGEDGRAGLGGSDGADGQPADNGVGHLKDGHWLALTGTPPTAGRKGNGGGGGGAGGNCGEGTDMDEFDSGGAGGDGGRGGCGGAAGENGGSGGASILLLAIDTELTIEEVVGVPGKGGDGGDGSQGAQGESGQRAPGGDGTTVSGAGNGGDGAFGGDGGDGGHGAGGCGGPSYGVARDADSTVTGGLTIDANAFDPSQPGNGAQGAQPGCAGDPGQTAEDKLIPDAP
jgi:hypothetical protein